MSTQAVSKKDIIKKHFSLLCDLRRQYKFTIITDERDNDPIITYDLSDIQAVTPYLEFLKDELSIYPAGVVNKLHLDRIIVCSNLKKVDKPVTGCASMSLLFPDNLALRMLFFKKNTIYLDISYGGTVDGLVTIHHELFHALEAHGESWPKSADFDWPILNPTGFQYKAEVSDVRRKEYPLDVDGFLTDYSMETFREDKAELFSHMIVNLARVEEFAKKDKILKSKIQRLKWLLGKFSSDFNEQFWATRHQHSLQGALKNQYDDLLLNRLRK